MELKEYQRRVCDEVESFLGALDAQYAGGNRRYGAMEVWRSSGLGKYNPRKNGLGEDLPAFCIKVPTGGGKTLLATQALGSIHRTILKERNGAGLVLWIVPSSQIYRDTLKRLRDRNDLYRLMLEHALSRRIEVWEKHEINRLTPARLRECLNILVIQLASTNRETNEQLKFFRDSGGNIVRHFPPENDPDAHRKLKEECPNLDMIEDDAETGRCLIKTSIGNLVRLCRPAVILDEGHKATSQLARQTIEGFNASIVVELSATPHKDANILCRVSGEELLAEEMIKLPMNIAASNIANWQDLLTKARDKRAALAIEAAEYESDGGQAIRPIVLVQVERTGKDQRGSGMVHADDVREYLTQNLSVSASAVAVKTADNDGLEDVDLMDPGCRVEWIITKSALQEGWDCPFAYILVSLSGTGSERAMTQLVGRILRQPHQAKTRRPALDESFVYCRHRTSGEIARQVKKALEREGYEEGAQSMIVDASAGPDQRNTRIARIRPELLGQYRKPFDGKIYLPRFCVKEKTGYRKLDYFEHLVSRVDVETFQYDKINWPLADHLKAARDQFYRYTLEDHDLRRQYDTEADLVETDDQVLAWLAANVRFDFLSHKSLRYLVRRIYGILCDAELLLKDRLALVKFILREHIERFIQEQVDRQTHEAFERLFESNKIIFYLECAQCRFEIPESITIARTGGITPLIHDDGAPVGKSLFDFVESESANQYERQIALVLDRDKDVLWWYRNRVGPENFEVQGYRKDKIYPDFVVQNDRTREYSVLVLESKGEHLAGNLDTQYKRNVAEYFSKAGNQVTWQQLGEEFKDHKFRFQILDEAQLHGRDWRDELGKILQQ